MLRALAPLLAAALLSCAAEPTRAPPSDSPVPKDSQTVGASPVSQDSQSGAAAADPQAGSRAVPVREDIPAGPPALQRHSVTADGHAIAVHAKRPGAPWGAVVLVHGRTWSALPDFDLQVAGAKVSLMDNLAAAGLAVYAVDLRGYGSTARDATGYLTPTRAADDLATVLRFVAGESGMSEKPAVLGWSLGARVAALAAQRHPDTIGALVLYGAPCDDPRKQPAMVADPGPPAKQANTAEAARSDFITPDALEPGVADAFVAAALAADPVKADWRDQHVWASTDFRALRSPVLAIHGDRDPVVDAACLRQRLAEIPGGATIEVLTGYDHAAHLERAAPRFVELVVGFLRKHASTK